MLDPVAAPTCPRGRYTAEHVERKGDRPPLNILVLNAGSSSQKCALYRLDGPPPDAAPPPVWEAHADGAKLKVRTIAGELYTETLPSAAPAEALPHLLSTLWDGPAAVLSTSDEIAVVGHRVVHGGRTYRDPTVLTPAIEADLEAALASQARVLGVELGPERGGLVGREQILSEAEGIVLADDGELVAAPGHRVGRLDRCEGGAKAVAEHAA